MTTTLTKTATVTVTLTLNPDGAPTAVRVYAGGDVWCAALQFRGERRGQALDSVGEVLRAAIQRAHFTLEDDEVPA